MVKKQLNNKPAASLFDIRLKNDHDVLVLKGSEHDAASALLSGKIALSVNEPLTVKKMTLRLYGTLRLNWTDTVTTPKGNYPKPNRFEKKVYEYNWDSSEINKYLNNLYENSNNNANSIGSLSRNHSTTSLKSFGHSLRSKSSNNLSHLSSLTNSSSSNLANLSHASSSSNLSGNSKTHTLVQGNYEIPFSAILPGDMPESVEGLPGCNVSYKLEAIIDRGKFHNNMVTKKHVRVIRTLTTDSIELSETVAVDNTWPKKVEYSLNVPSKAIAIGSGTPISFMLVPLLKGLKLGDIKISLNEYYSYVGYIPPPYNGERLVCEKFIPKPNDDDPNFQMDKWEVDTFLKIPPSLSKGSQDCDIQTHIKIRHKLKFVIGLINPDGHVSELRASLPVQLFISPFVTIKAKYEDGDNLNSANNSAPDLNRSTSQSSKNNLSPNDNNDDDNDDDDEEAIFTSDPHSASHTSLTQLAIDSGANSPNGDLRSNSNSFTSFTGMIAPPLYEKHIYDRLWSDVSPIESPVSSGAATPRNNLYGSSRPLSNDVQNQFQMSPLDSVQLNENLRQLSLQRQLQESMENTPNSGSNTPRDRPVFNLDGESSNQNPEVTSGDYFTRGRPIINHRASSEGLQMTASPLSSSANNGLVTPGAGLQSPPVHLSRAASENNVINPATLSKVPTYSQAIRSDNHDEVLSPAYEPPLPGSNINMDQANRNFEETRGGHYPTNGLNNHQRNRSFISRGSSSANLRNMASRNSSNNSSPSNSRNVSFTNLSALSPSSLSRSSSKRGDIDSTSGSSGTNVNTPTPPAITVSGGHGGSSSAPLSSSPVGSAFKTHDIPAHLLHNNSIRQPSSSAHDRSAAVMGPKSPVPNKSASSLNLHNLHFLNKKKGDKK